MVSEVFWVIDAPDLDVALELAAEGSRACRAKVEVRPFNGPPEPVRTATACGAARRPSSGSSVRSTAA